GALPPAILPLSRRRTRPDAFRTVETGHGPRPARELRAVPLVFWRGSVCRRHSASVVGGCRCAGPSAAAWRDAPRTWLLPMRALPAQPCLGLRSGDRRRLFLRFRRPFFAVMGLDSRRSSLWFAAAGLLSGLAMMCRPHLGLVGGALLL